MDFRILQVNLQNSRAATLQLHQHLAENNFQIALLQDAFVHPGADKPIGTPLSWRTFAAQSHKTHILVNLDIAPMVTYRGVWSVSIKLETQGESVEITNTYAPPRADFQSILQELDKVFSQKESRIIAGDYNAHSRQWGYSDDDNRGNQLSDIMAANNMMLINVKGSPPSFLTHRSRGWPDLTFSSPELCMNIIGWKVNTEDDSLSDHRYIEFKIGRVNTEAGRHRLLTDKGQHQRFKNGLKKVARQYVPRLNSVTLRAELENTTESLLKDLRVLARSCYKEAQIKKRGTASWWSPGLQMERQKLRALRRRFQRATEEAQKEEYKLELNKGQARYKRLIIKARENKWRQFCTDAKEAYGPQYKILSKKLSEPPSLMALLERRTNSQKEYMESCLEELFLTQQSNDGASVLVQDPFDEELVQDNVEEVSSAEINRILACLRSNKAAGYDCIDYVPSKKG